MYHVNDVPVSMCVCVCVCVCVCPGIMIVSILCKHTTMTVIGRVH